MEAKQQIKSFKDLVVWQKAIELVTLIYKMTAQFPQAEIYGLTSQMRRAAVSIPSNIAEEFHRKTNKERVQFLRVSYGSGAELETQLCIGKALGYVSSEYFGEVQNLLTEILSMLNVIIRDFESKI